MTIPEAQGWVLLVTAIFSALALAITTILTPVFTYLTSKAVKEVQAIQVENAKKLEVIHQSTNGGLSAMQKRLDEALIEIERVRSERASSQEASAAHAAGMAAGIEQERTRASVIAGRDIVGP